MRKLNLPEYTFNIRLNEGKEYLFDPVRKKEVRLTPEEWVRQSFIMYLHHEKDYPLSLMQVEKEFTWNGRSWRSDLLVFSPAAEPRMIVECKAPEVKLDNAVFEQIARYNIKYHVPYLVVTNGLVHYCCRMDYAGNTYHFLREIPGYSLLIQEEASS
jgi:hypothetical protein